MVMLLNIPQAVAFNAANAFVLLLAFAAVAAVALWALWRGPSRWPGFAQKMWEDTVPERAREPILRIAASPVVWLIIGMLVGAATITPLAIWLRAILPN